MKGQPLYITIMVDLELIIKCKKIDTWEWIKLHHILIEFDTTISVFVNYQQHQIKIEKKKFYKLYSIFGTTLYCLTYENEDTLIFLDILEQNHQLYLKSVKVIYPKPDS